jgi:hypothetical protein
MSEYDADAAANYGPVIAADIAVIEQALPPALRSRFARVCGAIDEYAGDAMLADQERIWRLTLAHFAGIAPALELVRAHVMGEVEACCENAGDVDQRFIGARTD